MHAPVRMHRGGLPVKISIHFDRLRRTLIPSQYQIEMAPLPTLTDRPVTACGLRRLAVAVLKTKHGDPWDAGMVNQRTRQLENWAVNTGFYDPAQGTVVDCPYGALFAADNEPSRA